MLLHSSADLLPDVDALRCMTDVDAARPKRRKRQICPAESVTEVR